MAVKKKGLGRGLDALFPEKSVKSAEKKPEQKSEQKQNGTETSSFPHQLSANTETASNGTAVKAAEMTDSVESVSEEQNKSEMLVKISKVEPNRSQPRKQFGILQPLLVSDKGNYYEIIAGERRWRAAKLAGLKEVPVIIKEFNDQQVVEISLIENIQREDLNPIEEAMAYKRLIEEFQLKQDSIAERVSKSRTAVTNSLRLLKLDDRVQQMLIDEMISAGHARAILAIADKDKQASVAMKVFDEKLSVRETEKLVKHIVEPPKKTQKPSNTAEDAIYESLEEKMKGIMGTRVFIHRKKNNKGKIEIEYYSRDELERIIELFESIR